VLFKAEREELVMMTAVRLVDEAWGAVAERRLDELLSGRVQGIPAEEVFEKARRLIL